MKKNFIISGIQGSGKGTQARLLETQFGWVHIGTGILCRWHLDHRTLYGRQLNQINKGKLATDDLMIEIVQRRLDIHDPEYCFLLDGFPRNRIQADYIFGKHEFSAVIHLDLSSDMALQRAQGRKDGKQVRADDNEEALKVRFELYKSHTEPLLEYYSSLGILHRIDASSHIENVNRGIVQSLRSKGLVPAV